MEEEFTLFLVTIKNPSSYADDMYPVYARDERQAQEKAQALLKQAQHFHAGATMELRAYPDGFSLQTRFYPGKRKAATGGHAQ